MLTEVYNNLDLLRRIISFLRQYLLIEKLKTRCLTIIYTFKHNQVDIAFSTEENMQIHYCDSLVDRRELKYFSECLEKLLGFFFFAVIHYLKMMSQYTSYTNFTDCILLYKLYSVCYLLVSLSIKFS